MSQYGLRKSLYIDITGISIMPRRFRGRSRSFPRSVVQSFKKVHDHAGASFGSGINTTYILSNGVDSVPAGQTGVIDPDVPTGSVIKSILITICPLNITSNSTLWHFSIQRLHSGQSSISPNVIGGDPQRNQVFHQKLRILGKDQNQNVVINFKIPSKYQRVREGDQWIMNTLGTNSYSQGAKVIYKFFR